MEKEDKVAQGKKNRRNGALFELKVRKDLESERWIVDKWTNNIRDGELKPALSNRFNMRSCGFPDFICFKLVSEGFYQVWGVEVKTNGYLSKEEKEKCKWYLDNKIFSKIWIASYKYGRIVYKEFK